MVVIPFLKGSLVRTHIYLFIITIIITTVIGAGDLKLHIIHYIFILAFALKGTSGLINEVAFGELDMLFLRFSVLHLLIKFATQACKSSLI